jgi:Lhr-like helicase
MPIRGHIFSRGMPRLSVCPRCSSFHKLETLRCDQTLDSGIVCNARPFELVYGRSTGVAFLNLWLERLDSTEGRDGLEISTQIQFAWSSSTAGPERTRRVALASWRCTKEDAYTHILDMDKGSIRPKNTFNASSFDVSRHAYLKVAGFSDNGQFDWKSLWKNSFDKKDIEFFDRKCPATKRDHTYRRARQVSNLETRGNEAFSALIDGLMQQQDDVLESRHLPNGGKKCLVFSDSRQQAANVAVELGQLSNHDETRRLLMSMLLEPWFQALPSEHRSVTGMFPWFTLYCTSKGMNPFAGGDYAHDRSRFAASGVNTLASILAARATKFAGDSIEFGQHKVEVETLINQFKPSHCQPFSFKNLEFLARIRYLKNIINDALPSALRPSGLDMKVSDTLKKQLQNIDNYSEIAEVTKIIESLEKSIDESNWTDFNETIGSTIERIKKALTEEIPDELFQGIFESIVTIINHEWLIASTELAPLASKCIEIGNTPQVLDFIEEYNAMHLVQDHLPIHNKEHGRWTDGWSQFMVKILFDGEYGVEEIGIGFVQINDYYWNKLDSILQKKFPEARYLIPRMFSKSFKSNVVKKARVLENAIFSSERMPAFNPAVIAKGNLWGGNDTPGATDSRICQKLIEDLYKRQDDIKGMLLTKLIRSLSEKGILETSYAKAGLNAESLEIIPTIDTPIRLCSQCYRPRTTPEDDQTKCGACESNSFVESSKSEFSKRYKALRIDPWRRSISQLIDGSDDVFLLRVEEHTAQIGDKLDKSDLYSPAELHELQFQDIPVPDSTSVINNRSSLPPIDVLSCTTTMEVGIDIGSLTCVALRSMPPHSANYQQRIGRAGRGASEVSVALTWADNSAYAQQLYEQPERLLHHPDSPPILYMENRRIQQRHFQASLLQLFMKHRPYIRDLLIFDGMANEDQGISPSMVESLGLVGDFFEKKDNHFGFKSFKHWLINTANEDFISEHFANNAEEILLHQQWKEEFVAKLTEYREA